MECYTFAKNSRGRKSEVTIPMFEFEVSADLKAGNDLVQENTSL
jgi:hypothetical protein